MKNSMQEQRNKDDSRMRKERGVDTGLEFNYFLTICS